MARLLWVFSLAGFLGLIGEFSHAEGPETEPSGIESDDGDRVVFLGNAFFEREQEFGYLETELTRHWMGPDPTFRNLGRTGDTVWGDAWARFETPVEGFQRRRDLVIELKPTVIFVAYGMNESFAGEAGLPKFVEGLNALLDSLAPTKAEIGIISPTWHERLPPPLPDPTEHNKALRLYRDAMAKVAQDRELDFFDLIEARIGDGTRSERVEPCPETVEGIHLNAFGYWNAAGVLGRLLGLDKAPKWSAHLIAGDDPRSVTSKKTALISDLEPTTRGLRFRSKMHLLPNPPIPEGAPRSLDPDSRRLRVDGLAAGRYILRIDGEPFASGTHEEWARGVPITDSPERRQAEALRLAIVAKNRLLDYRYRPANWTYLYGFRKHEQGQNAAEIPEFDPLVADKEAEIAKLRQPRPHTYELVREEGER